MHSSAASPHLQRPTTTPTIRRQNFRSPQTETVPMKHGLSAPILPLAPTIYSLVVWTGLLWGPPGEWGHTGCVLSGFCHCAQCPPGRSTRWQAVGHSSFLRLDPIPACGWTTSCLCFIHGWTLGLLGLRPLGRSESCCCGHVNLLGVPAFSFGVHTHKSDSAPRDL